MKKLFLCLFFVLSFSTFVFAGTSLNPTISTSVPTNSTIDPNSVIVISVDTYRDVGVSQITYCWNNEEPTNFKNINGISVIAPNISGVHILKVCVIDNNGYVNVGDSSQWSTFRFVIGNSVPDDSEILISALPSTGYIESESDITISVSPTSSVSSVSYSIDGDEYKQIHLSAKGRYTFSAPRTIGKFTLYVCVVDINGIEYNKSFNYRLFSNDVEDNPPTISIVSYSGQILRGTSVTVKVKDESDLLELSYYWNDNEVKDVSLDDDNTFTISSPSKYGSHTLHVYAKDIYKNSKAQSFKFEVVDWLEPDDNGILNSNVSSLRIELNRSEANSKFTLDEEVELYVDFYNGFSFNVDSCEISLELPNGFKVISAQSGTTANNKTITWNVKNLESGEAGRFLVRLKCTDLYNKSEKIHNFSASLKRYNNVIDTSTLNALFYDDAEILKHSAYMFDVDNDNFYPNQGLTRAEFAVLIAKALSLGVNDVSYYSNPFNDIDSSTWGYSSIISAYNAGLINGYSDGSFKPDDVILRAEIATIFAKYLNINESVPVWKHFSDLDNNWAENAMEQLARYNILQGYGTGKAGPKQAITRAEAITMINRFLYRGALVTNKILYSDVPRTHWAYGDIAEASITHEFEIDSATGDEVRY